MPLYYKKCSRIFIRCKDPLFIFLHPPCLLGREAMLPGSGLEIAKARSGQGGTFGVTETEDTEFAAFSQILSRNLHAFFTVVRCLGLCRIGIPDWLSGEI